MAVGASTGVLVGDIGMAVGVMGVDVGSAQSEGHVTASLPSHFPSPQHDVSTPLGLQLQPPVVQRLSLQSPFGPPSQEKRPLGWPLVIPLQSASQLVVVSPSSQIPLPHTGTLNGAVQSSTQTSHCSGVAPDTSQTPS